MSDKELLSDLRRRRDDAGRRIVELNDFVAGIEAAIEILQKELEGGSRNGTKRTEETQRTKVTGPRTADHGAVGRKAEDRGQRSEVRGQETEVGGQDGNGSEPTTAAAAVLRVMRERPNETHTTDSLLAGVEKFGLGIKRMAISRAAYNLRSAGLVKSAERGLFILARTVLEPEDRGQRSEDRGQRSEDRGQRSEDRGQRSEDRGQRSEDRGQRTEVGGQNGRGGQTPRRPLPVASLASLVAHAGKDSPQELKTATELERLKQGLGIPSGAAVAADPELLANKRRMGA